MYGFIADAIAVLHLVFVIFVVLGVLAVRRWPRIAWLHIPAVLWAAYVETTGASCPLTPWETEYRELAGEPAYSGDFVGNYIVNWPPTSGGLYRNLRSEPPWCGHVGLLTRYFLNGIAFFNSL